MSTTLLPSPRRDAPSSAAGFAVVFAIGVLAGVVLVVVSLRAFEGRRTWQDHYPAAVMQLYQAHMAQLSGKLDANRCGTTDTLAQLQTMRAVSNDLEPAFEDLRDHRGFLAHAAEMRRTLDTMLAAPPADCTHLRRAIDQLGEHCRACHQDLRR